MRTLGMVMVFLLLAGCTDSRGGGREDGDGPTPGRSPAPPATVVDELPTSATRTWSTPVKALQRPVPAGDVLVTVVAARGDELDLVALDRRDGAVRWRRPLMVVNSDVGAYLGELVHTSADGETYVVMQEARTGPALRAGARLPYLALDPATGEVVARTRPVVAQFGAPACDDGLDVCLRISADDRFEETRWVLGSWELQPEKDRLPVGANSLVAGSDVYTVYGPVQQYAVAKAVGRAGPRPWRLPHTRVTGGDQWLLDDSNGMVDEEAGVAVLQLLATTRDRDLERYERGQGVRFDLAQRRTVGVDVETGDILWRHRGADIRCLELTRTEVPVRCAFSGARVYREGAEPRLVSGRGFLEGFDPRTGETTWRQRLGSAAVRTLTLDVLTLDAEVDRIIDADELVVVPTPSGPRLLSLVDGSSRPVAAGEALLCRDSVPYRHRFDTADTGVGGFGDTRARQVAAPCRPDGKSSDEPLGATALLTGGVDAGEGVHVVVRRGAVEGYTLS
ncbi:PQQ-binding-like beta-propeller repeat protein [Nocardioides lacusdianchii]|uniref:PQQ-binding-like beta-propeller repeat protein n=1 Tax=Nocardioides lacusdianchii TaxID=2783664 RepID=UPI001CCC0E8E|nr:PQQ-binding-like beta-propeller repeat protein [Nocardioides lacusdianchii]